MCRLSHINDGKEIRIYGTSEHTIIFLYFGQRLTTN